MATMLLAAGGNPAFSPSPPHVDEAVAQQVPATTVPAYIFVDLGTGPNGWAALAQGADTANQAGNYIYTRDSCGKACSFNVYHALAWSGSGSKPIDINPPIQNFAESWVYGGSGTLLVGTGITNQGGYFGVPHALICAAARLRGKTSIRPAIAPRMRMGRAAVPL